MRTEKPISTISYNTEKNLKVLCDSLIKNGQALFYCFILHKPERDGKPHIHLYLEPHGVLDTEANWFKTYFQEKDPNNENPLDVMPWKKSKWQDFYYYSLHDARYLKAKGLKREYHYTREEFQYSNENDFLDREEECDPFGYSTPMEKILACREEGLTVFQAMSKCKVSYGAMVSFSHIWKNLDDIAANERAHQEIERLKAESEYIKKSRWFDKESGILYHLIPDDPEQHYCSSQGVVIENPYRR